MSAPTIRRAHVWITGRVQGVSFRYACERVARAAGVAGWVRNRIDGRVEAVFEGAPAAVEEVVEWCNQGPSAARVTHVERRDEEPVDEPAFHVAPTA